MDLFGSFSFGRLIKTFLPGFLLFMGFWLYLDLFFCFAFKSYLIFKFAEGNSVLFIAFLIPISIALGVFSNTIFFIQGYKRIVEKSHESKYPEFCEFEKKILLNIKEEIVKKLSLPEDFTKDFVDSIDIQTFILNKTEVDKILFMEESFWYYLEFQINILLALNFLTPGVLILWLKISINTNLNWVLIGFTIIIFLLLIVALNIIFVSSARKNYRYHKRNSLSLTVGGYYYSNFEAPSLTLTN